MDAAQDQKDELQDAFDARKIGCDGAGKPPRNWSHLARLRSCIGPRPASQMEWRSLNKTWQRRNRL